MLFVDGENFTIRAQEAAKGIDKPLGGCYCRDAYFWALWVDQAMWPVLPRDFAGRTEAERRYYYTCLTGDDDALNNARDDLIKIGFSPVVMKKVKGTRAKGVDISLTKDMLVHAFFNNYDIAVLVAGDGDYVPVVEELKRLGRRVVVAFFDEKAGMSTELRRAGDTYVTIDMDKAPSEY